MATARAPWHREKLDSRKREGVERAVKRLHSQGNEGEGAWQGRGTGRRGARSLLVAVGRARRPRGARAEGREGRTGGGVLCQRPEFSCNAHPVMCYSWLN